LFDRVECWGGTLVHNDGGVNPAAQQWVAWPEAFNKARATGRRLRLGMTLCSVIALMGLAPTETFGFEMGGWALHLEVDPPPPPPPPLPLPPPPPTVITVTVPPTGKRAEALSKCKKKKTRAKKQACRSRAARFNQRRRSLP
jgi:hypothetical protein